MQHLFLATAVAFACSSLLAQTSGTCLPIGTGGAHGCQSPTRATLTGDVVATGDIDFAYDPATAVLTVVVENTSPIVIGETNPVITRIGFNFPAKTVSSATLLSQAGTGGATPSFSLGFSATQSLGMGCFGGFSAVLAITGVQGAIGNAAATVLPHPVVVLGPVTFRLQLGGSGVATLTAGAIASTTSQGGHPSVAAGVKFQGGGVNGEESGWVSSGASACCLHAASVLAFGAGCAPAPLSIPTIASIGAPIPGGPIGVNVSSPSTPGAFGVVIYGFSSTFDPVNNLPLPIPLGPVGFPGCSILASTEFSVGVLLDGNGDGTHSFQVPALAKWCDREITFQAFFLPTGNGLLSTAAITAILGS